MNAIKSLIVLLGILLIALGLFGLALFKMPIVLTLLIVFSGLFSIYGASSIKSYPY